MNEAEIRFRFLKNITEEANMKLVYEGGLKWKELDQENKVIKYIEPKLNLENSIIHFLLLKG